LRREFKNFDTFSKLGRIVTYSLPLRFPIDPEEALKKRSSPILLPSFLFQAVRDRVPDFGYSSLCLSSPRPIVVPDEIATKRSFVFQGPQEHRFAAWASFSEICPVGEFVLVSCMGVVFFFNFGKAKAMGLTGRAHSRLEVISKNLPEIDLNEAVQFIQKYIHDHDMLFYSSVQFDNSKVTPLIRRDAELESSQGHIYRTTLVGCIFAPILEMLKDCNPGACVATAILKV
jgi:hypothetical protein